MKVIGVIPARWASVRFKGKVLADIQGKPMIQHIWERAKSSRLLAEVFIACDDQKVLNAVHKFGGQAIMTSPDLLSGTDRIAEAVKNLDVDIVVNIQGDEPLVEHKMIDDLAQSLVDDPACSMSTVIKPCHQWEEVHDPNIVKAVIDLNGYALYFSRSVIPYHRDSKDGQGVRYYKHLGLYAYRKEFLMNFKDLPASALEKTEKLEQLRVLEAGHKIKTVMTDVETASVDTPEDLMKVKELLAKR
ncbi:MAG: 3-deoxy-manno-octulosonate cytidylyltransferase [Candidatus Omnitrophota bacterium]